MTEINRVSNTEVSPQFSHIEPVENDLGNFTRSLVHKIVIQCVFCSCVTVSVPNFKRAFADNEMK